MKAWQWVSLVGLWVVSAGCAAVDVPTESYYRLAVPPLLEPPAAVSAAALRVEGFELAATLTSDRLLVARSPVQLHAHEFHRWLNPLEHLVQDAVRTGLARVEAFAEVRGPADGLDDGLVLTGRVLEFQQVPLGVGWGGKVALELRLLESPGQRVLLREEFAATTAMGEATPAAAVAALSTSTGEVLRRFLRRCAEVGVLSAPAAPSRPR